MLQDGSATELAGELNRRTIPFVIDSGFPPRQSLPSELQGVPWLEKSTNPNDLLIVLKILMAVSRQAAMRSSPSFLTATLPRGALTVSFAEIHRWHRGEHENLKRPLGGLWSDMTTADEIEALLSRSPGLTEAEIAATLFGDASSLPRISGACRSLIKRRRIERSGRGGRNDPFRYFPKGALTVPSSPLKRRRYLM